MGTSAPELIVNIFSALKGQSDIVFGNVIGSNISNIFLILGTAGFIYPLAVQKNTAFKEIPFAIFSGILFFVMVNDTLLFNAPANLLSRIDGLVLLFFFIVFILYAMKIAKVNHVENEEKTLPDLPVWKIILFLALGFSGLFFGGSWVVDNAVWLAKKIGISEKLISLTIVSIGTSLPELATSAVAAYQRKSDIAVGNIVGSVILNVFFVLGATPLFKPVSFDPAFNSDMVVFGAGLLLLFLFMFTGKRKKLDRLESLIFLSGYIAYIVYLINRN